MVDSVTNTSAVNADAELSGRLAKAAGRGAEFSLILAMLEQNVLYRPSFASDSDEVVTDPHFPQRLNHYPPVSLKADATHFSKANVTNRLFSQSQVKNAQLWLAMHPDPLSMFNDPSRIDDEVIHNCDFATQRHLKLPEHAKIDVDYTKMLDVVEAAQVLQ
ncbi:VC2046/SO_2500 family protein [Aestuariibacter salexigens]|uniref:VC2046/SO_2500 family protein n=1 Tax=Aestuariibacter salexigens TaxID=226010 RepID=UPI0003FE56F1|nr:VC2046/SO_2500 family protein [Aestuariibacter salexigens]